jgi:hypothetical protein
MTQIRLNQLLETLPGALADEEAMLLFRGASPGPGVAGAQSAAMAALAVGVLAQPAQTRSGCYWRACQCQKNRSETRCEPFQPEQLRLAASSLCIR